MGGDRADSDRLAGGPEDLDALHRLLRQRPYRQAFGRWVRTLRTGRGWERAELGHLTGLATSTVGNVEGGLTRLSRHALRRMLEVLVGTNPQWVFIPGGSGVGGPEWWEFEATGRPPAAASPTKPGTDLERLDRLSRHWGALPAHIQMALADLVEAAVSGGRLPRPDPGTSEPEGGAPWDPDASIPGPDDVPP